MALKDFFKPRFRIVRDCWCGYEAQVLRWYWPFWCEMHEKNYMCNTHYSLEEAQDFIDRKVSGGVRYEPRK